MYMQMKEEGEKNELQLAELANKKQDTPEQYRLLFPKYT